MLTVSGDDAFGCLLRVRQSDALALAGFVEPKWVQAIIATHKPFVLIDLWALDVRSFNIDNLTGVAWALAPRILSELPF